MTCCRTQASPPNATRKHLKLVAMRGEDGVPAPIIGGKVLTNGFKKGFGGIDETDDGFVTNEPDLGFIDDQTASAGALA